MVSSSSRFVRVILVQGRCLSSEAMDGFFFFVMGHAHLDGLLNVLFLMDYLGRKNNLFLS